jgi:hypothetical protein
LLGHPDSEVAAAARKEKRILFTLDVGLADLRKYPPGSHHGIVVFRPASLGPLSVNRFVESFAKKVSFTKIAGALVIVEPDRIRVRGP